MPIKNFNKSIFILAIALAACAATPQMMRGKASAGLITLATTGNPAPLRREIGGTIIPSAELQKQAGKVLDLKKKEHLAPKALVLKDGDIYAMVAPTITKDNFIYVHQGKLIRMDVGFTEGHNNPFVVNEIKEDGGASIWEEIGYWFSNLFDR